MAELDPIRRFAQLMEREDEEINLAEAALLIACTEYPRLDVSAYLGHLDRLAGEVFTDASLPPLANIQALHELLFEKEGFSGDNQDYEDPRNSYLNDVLERKKGIPVTLSLIYMEVARRRNLPVVGVGFPGHFLVKYLTRSGGILIDPYQRGALVSREDCEKRLRDHFGAEAEFKSEYLATCSHKQVLMRLLKNLKASYFRRRDFPRVLTMIELGLLIDPHSRCELHDRGIVYFLARRYAEAKADFRAYLNLSPPDDPEVEDVLKALHHIRGMIN